MYASILAFLTAFASRAFIFALLFQVLVGLGVATVAYTGLTLLMDAMLAQVVASVGSTLASQCA